MHATHTHTHTQSKEIAGAAAARKAKQSKKKFIIASFFFGLLREQSCQRLNETVGCRPPAAHADSSSSFGTTIIILSSGCPQMENPFCV
jgi:hypothetical protein